MALYDVLTRNLDRLELQCAHLTELIHRLKPDIDIDKLIADSSADGPANGSASGSVSGSTEFSKIFASVCKENTTSDSETDSASVSTSSIKPYWPKVSIVQADSDNEEYDSTNTRSMEWHEGQISASSLDGMCFWKNDSEKSGFIGKTAALSALKMVFRILNIPASERDNCYAQLSSMDAQTPQKVDSIVANLQLQNTAIRDSFVDTYFCKFHILYPLLHEPTFRKRYHQLDTIPKISHFHILLRMVLAIGSLCTANAATSDNDYYFYMSARSLLSADMFESGTFEQLQILLLMANYLQKRDKPNTGYNFLGLAVHMAVSMGLHREPNRSELNEYKNTLVLETRRRIWWCLFIFDSGAALTFGRPPIIADSLVKVKLPLNIIDSTLTEDTPVPPPVLLITPYSGIIHFAKLSIIMDRMHRELYSLVTSQNMQLPKYYEKVTEFEQSLLNWRSELPPEYTSTKCPQWFLGVRAVSLWREQNVRLIMYKRYLEAASLQHYMTQPEIIKKCHTAANITVTMIEEFISHTHQPITWEISWYAVYYLVQADLLLAVIYLLCLRDNRTKDNTGNDCLNLLSKSKELFLKFESSNGAALRCSQVVGELLRLMDLHVRRQSEEVKNSDFDPGSDSFLDIPEGMTDVWMDQDVRYLGGLLGDGQMDQHSWHSHV